EGDAYRTVALYGAPPAFAEARQREPVIRAGPGISLHQAAITRQPVQVADIQAEPAYTNDPQRFAILKLAGARTVLSVPMLKDDRAVGVISIYGKEVRPFTDKQIELLKNFAAQAVIAIENARLLNELRQRTDDLSESLEQQTATSEVLKVISSSFDDLKPVFDTIGQRAEKLCSAGVSVISMVDGDLIRLVSVHGITDEGVEAVRRVFPMRRNDETVTARAIRSATVCHVPDVLSDALYQPKDAARVSGYRACLAVPMIRDGQVVGAIFVARKQAGLFAEAQVALLKTFADQAIIAIESGRFSSGLREPLQQQTATADVLKVISRSTFDLQTVLDTLVQSAARLCDADMASVTRPREADGAYYHVAHFGFSPEWFELMQTNPLRPGRETLIGRTLLEGRVVHIPDVLTDPEYNAPKAQQLGEFRAALGVPMLREGTTLGVFMIARRTPRPFTDKQIELATTFADQAVIAIENVRMFEEVQARTRELSESLEQQTATSEVLQVISRSPGELEPVFKAMLANATDICEAKFGFLWLAKGDGFRAVAML